MLKNAGSTLLVEAVRAAVRGDALISPSVTVRLLEHLTVPAAGQQAATAVLTALERKVIARVAGAAPATRSPATCTSPSAP